MMRRWSLSVKAEEVIHIGRFRGERKRSVQKTGSHFAFKLRGGK
jgi:hypothetical protein